MIFIKILYKFYTYFSFYLAFIWFLFSFYIIFIIKYLGTGEDHDFLIPVLAYNVEMLLKYVLGPKQKLLLLKCDGLQKNKNVPKKIAKLLLKKYKNNPIIESVHGVYVYQLEDLIVILIVCNFYSSFILFLYNFYIIFIQFLYNFYIVFI